jgi:protein-export membrane protein SecD
MLQFPLWKVLVILLVVGWGLLSALPNVLPASVRSALPGFLPSQTLNLGLDLQGGSHIALEVDATDVRKNKLEELSRDLQRVLLNEQPRIPFRNRSVEGDNVRVRIVNEADVPAAIQRLRAMSIGVNALEAGINDGPVVERRADNFIELSLSDEAVTVLTRDAVARSLEVVRRRIDELGTREPSIQRQGENRIIVQVPGETDPARLASVITQAARMTFNLVDDEADIAAWQRGETRPGWRLVPSPGDAGGFLVIQTTPIVTGEQLVNAQQNFDGETGNPVVAFQLNNRGAVDFGRASTENRGERFAIVLDDEVVSAPVIRTPITTGSGQIEGGFTTETALDLALMLRAGALPAKLQVVEERTVSADLGEASVRAGVTAAIGGLALTAIFMMINYGVLGVFSVVSLAVNIAMLLGALSAVGATLTLPGIAGIILTMGMAVDANVLVFERIHEESRQGRGALSAVQTGYQGALSTILDANITTLLAAIVLMYLGAGPVRGFAITLGLGILTSVFTAFLFTRLMTVVWLRTAKPKTVLV